MFRRGRPRAAGVDWDLSILNLENVGSLVMHRCMLWTFCLTIACLSSASRGFAASDSWATNLSGSWSVTGNWASGTAYATCADATADFSVLSGGTVTDDLTTNTIGYLSFGSSGVTISPAVSTNTLTMQTTVANTTPSTTVSGSAAVIAAILAGNQGLVKLGGGSAVLTASNTLTGPVTVNGTLSLTSGGAHAGSDRLHDPIGRRPFAQ